MPAARAGGLSAFVLLLLSALSARAQLPAQISIQWSDDASCPRPLKLSLESEVARLLGPRALSAEPAEFEARVERIAEHAALPYRLTLEVESKTHRAERTLDLSSCAEAQDAAALLIATAIDPDAVMRAAPARPAPPPEPEQPRAPPVTPRTWSLLARALFDAKSLPGPSGGPSMGVLLQRARYRAWGEARYLFARRQTADGEFAARAGAALGADVDLFAAALGGAALWSYGSWVVGPAAELELGVLRARGWANGPTAPSDGVGPWGALELGAVSGYQVHRRVGLELSLFAGLPLFRPRLAVRDVGAFYTTFPVTIRVAVGIRVSLGSP